MQEDKLL